MQVEQTSKITNEQKDLASIFKFVIEVIVLILKIRESRNVFSSQQLFQKTNEQIFCPTVL